MIFPKRYFAWLLPSVDVVTEAGIAFLIRQDGRVIELEDPAGVVSSLLSLLDGIRSSESWDDHPIAETLLAHLVDCGFVAILETPLTEIFNEESEFSREFSYIAHLLPHYPDRRVLLLKNRHALIVGAGGVGSGILQALCASQLGKVTIVDPDKIEISNLNRQFLYERSMVGRGKAKATAEAIAKRFRGTIVDGISINFDEAGVAAKLLKDVDMVIVCSESTILFENPDLCEKVPLLLAGYFGTAGIVGPLVDPKSGTACWECLMAASFRKQVELLYSAAIPRRAKLNPSGCAINLAVASFASSLAIRFLSQPPQADMLWGVRTRIEMATLSTKSDPCTPRYCQHTLACPASD